MIQEIDVRTGLVMFEWHALGHVPLTRVLQKPRTPYDAPRVWDWFHINSIDLEPDRNLLISSRNTWAIYQIGHTYGEVLWTLGGRSSSFTLGPGRALRLAARRDAPGRRLDRDLRQRGHARRSSRSRAAIDVGLDFQTHTATLLHSYVDPQAAGALAEPGRRAAARQHRPAGRLGADRPGLRVLRRRRADLRADAAAARRVLPRLPLPVDARRRPRRPLLVRQPRRRRDDDDGRGQLERGDRRRRLAGPRRARARRRSRRSARRSRPTRLRDARSRPPRPRPTSRSQALAASGQVLATSAAVGRRVAEPRRRAGRRSSAEPAMLAPSR